MSIQAEKMMNTFGADILREIIELKGYSLHRAAARNDLNRVKECISSSVDINKDILKYTPVQISLILGHDNISKLLLSNPTLDPKQINSLKWSYVSSIVERSSLDIIKTLFDRFITSGNTIKAFIDASCRTNRVDLLQMFLGCPKLSTHVRKNKELYKHVCEKKFIFCFKNASDKQNIQ